MIAHSDPVKDINSIVMSVVKEMPAGGGYDNKAPTLNLLKEAVVVKDQKLSVVPEKARPSFCSAATYLVFLKTLSRLEQSHALNMSSETARELLVLGAKEQPDGAGIWGRWNANGPGTARLFAELKLGRNFDLNKLSEARPGDFMKIFWTDEIGAKEHGHSVVFTGTEGSVKDQKICFWSSNMASQNQEAGMGIKCVAREKIHRALFSRLEFPENINQAPSKMAPGSASYVDAYLNGLLRKPSSVEEMNHNI